jgi:hypothetical protein
VASMPIVMPFSNSFLAGIARTHRPTPFDAFPHRTRSAGNGSTAPAPERAAASSAHRSPRLLLDKLVKAVLLPHSVQLFVERMRHRPGLLGVRNPSSSCRRSCFRPASRRFSVAAHFVH